MPRTGREKDGEKLRAGGNRRKLEEGRNVGMTDERAGCSEVGCFDKTEKSGYRPVRVLEDGGVPPFPNEPTGV